MDETTYPGLIKIGSRGQAVRRCQEWLSLRGLGLMVDGHFGQATKFAVEVFQRKHALPINGRINRATFDSLISPLIYTMMQSGTSGSLRRKILYYAKRHLRQHPREIGGQNRGPWVRFYMDGNEGPTWPWCAGFVSLVMEQACEELEIDMPITPSVSCDYLAGSAKRNNRFVDTRRGDSLDGVRAGDLFLSRRTSTDWVHVGIVKKLNEFVMLTIEGNTNDSGDREGYEVCQRIRSFKDKDFILMR
ncbi:MAG: peptidoglycan-binding protein [Gammaproteobacteria bacterium]